MLILMLGASQITTLEYDPYVSTDPRLTIITPTEFSNWVIKKNAPMFDAMVSFSSIEHSGLGRYLLKNHTNFFFKFFAVN